jgi:hypothetical protein
MLNVKKIRQLVEAKGADEAVRHLQTGLTEKVFKPDDFSLRDLAECLVVDRDGHAVGHEWIRALGPQKSGGLTLLESQASGIDLSRFSNITGQIFYNRVMEGYQQEEFMAAALIDNTKTDLNGEKIPGVTGFTDDIDDNIHEGMPYPQIGFNEDYVETPATTKKGRIVSVTKETLFFDRTKLVLAQAGKVGEVLMRRKEKRIWDMILGVTNTFKWRGTTYNTYQTATPWINVKSGVDSGVTAFDWTKVDEVEQLFLNMLEPNTSEPIVLNANQIVAMPVRRHIFGRVLNATRHEVRTQSGVVISDAPNTMQNYQLTFSKFMYRRLIASGVSASDAAHWWFMGDFKGAFTWMENWPLTVVQAPSNSEPEFTQDIVLRWKASERGAPAVIEPRKVVKVYNA